MRQHVLSQHVVPVLTPRPWRWRQLTTALVIVTGHLSKYDIVFQHERKGSAVPM
tara:strand:+ start:69 stop:230 length:162 start_codon:yes stop_codon:yes gene_type:complete